MIPRALRRRIGQLLLAGFNGPSIPPELRSLAREFSLGGVILFGRNIEAPGQVAELAYHARQLSGDLPTWVAIDQEGGRVARLQAPFTEWPPMATLGRSGDVRLAERFARALARELRAVGISLDFAPVLDLHTNPANPVIGDRALGRDPDLVARLGVAIVRGLQAGGVAACGKHFPGHGDTGSDSHLELPVVEHPPDRLRAVELVPFRAAIEADVASIMTAHVLFPALDEQHPATLSPALIDGVLRGELDYRGLVLSDDLDMRAIAGRYPLADAVVGALNAGCDGVLVCGADHDRQAAALEAIIRGCEAEVLALKKVEQALERHQRAKERFLTAETAGASGVTERRPLSDAALRTLIGGDEHEAIAHEMRNYL